MTTALTTTINANEAQVNVTYNGENGNLKDPVFNDSADGDIFAWVSEAVANGDIDGIPAQTADFSDFVVQRFAPNESRAHNLIMIRPKTPYGA
jgi:hypothetical protein